MGFFGWLLKKSWVSDVRLSMMMVGHTHEDIDAAFKLVVDKWKQWGCVLSPDDFEKMLRDSIPDGSGYSLTDQYIYRYKVL